MRGGNVAVWRRLRRHSTLGCDWYILPVWSRKRCCGRSKSIADVSAFDPVLGTDTVRRAAVLDVW